MREVTTQSAGGGIHTKFYSSSDSEPDELASSAVAVTHTESTSTLPCSKQPPPSGASKRRRNKRTFPSIVGGPSDVHTTRSVVHRRAEEPLTQELEDGTSSHGETKEEDKTSKETLSGEVELETVRDYTALPELHGAPRIGDQIAFKVVTFQAANIRVMKCVILLYHRRWSSPCQIILLKSQSTRYQQMCLVMCLDSVSRHALLMCLDSVSRLVNAVICLQEAAVLGYDASTKMVKLKLSEATLKQEMQKGETF